MKHLLHFVVIFMVAIQVQAQEATKTVSMGASYANQVFYKISTDQQSSLSIDAWDLAFLRTSSYDMGIRVNDAKGIEVYEASNQASDWSNIDVSNESQWSILYNSEVSWADGAFMQGSATYGWGEYNSANHQVTGSIIFVLKYADGTFRKFFIENFYGAYTFKYSTWDDTNATWSADEIVTLDNTENPNNFFNYYNLETNAAVSIAPAQDQWDLTFTKFTTEYPSSEGPMPYTVTGVLQNPNLMVAERDEPNGQNNSVDLTYSEEINTIGYDWKSFGGSGYTVNSDKAFYVKYADETIYRLVFTSFEGSSTGNIDFTTEDVTTTLGLEKIENSFSFGLYPNPTRDGLVELLFDNAKASDYEVKVYNLTGQLMMNQNIETSSQFAQTKLDVSDLSSGTYIVQIISNNTQQTKKLIVQ
ncbi:MAG: T9SS type A sorting domain-containing protein [Flavobacteriaceae bacterium]